MGLPLRASYLSRIANYNAVNKANDKEAVNIILDRALLIAQMGYGSYHFIINISKAYKGEADSPIYDYDFLEVISILEELNYICDGSYEFHEFVEIDFDSENKYILIWDRDLPCYKEEVIKVKLNQS